MALVPTLVLVVVAMVLAGPALGRLLFPASDMHTWRLAYNIPRPERTEHARFLLALTGPLVLSALTALLVRRTGPRRAQTTRLLVLGVQSLAITFGLACLIAQRSYTFHNNSSPHVVYFTIPTLAVGAALGLAAVWTLGSPAWHRQLERLTAESTARSIAALAAAAIVTALSLSPAIELGSTMARAPFVVGYHMGFTFDESLAVLDGRTPIGDFSAQYASLWPYVAAGAMRAAGATIGTFTIVMAMLSSGSLLALFDVLRRLTRRSLVALALFLPLLATSLYMLEGPPANRFSLANYFGTMPLRYAGPFLLAWLTARHLDGARPQRAWPLFLFAGLVLADNPEFGSAAVAATVAALLWARNRQRDRLGSLALEAAAGVTVAFAIVAALVLLRTGSPPNLTLALRYQRLFGVTGFGQIALRPVLGLSTIMYLTYLAAIGAASVRALRRDPGALLTGLLAWSGVFGLGAGSYYLGRSSPEVLTNMFPAWALATSVLAVLVGRQLARMPQPRATPAQAACMLVFGVMACSLAQTPTPWSQAQRLTTRTPPSIFTVPAEETFVAQHTRRGEPIALLTFLGQKTAVDLGVRDVTPYTGSSILTREQLDDVERALRASGGNTVFVEVEETYPEVMRVLSRDGFQLVARDAGIQMWQRKSA